ncbi:MAG: type II toxin-antitoxin system VapC family toxin [Sphingomonadaceae bacterium]
MKAVDTNILVRLIVEDDDEQVRRALAFCAQGVLVPLSVAMETEWVLRSRAKLGREDISRYMLAFMNSTNFHFDREKGLRWVIDRYNKGADFADMIHLIDAQDADAFATFDENIAKDAGSTPPLPVISI